MPWRVMLLGALLLASLVAVPSVVRAQIACGASITTSTGLTGDLDCSNYEHDPITIDADNVTFKLNGYTLTCSSQWGWYNTPYEADVEGIRATGRTGVQILGPGTITNCGRAITFEGGSNNTVQGLLITRNLSGPSFIWGANSSARNNVIVQSFLGGGGAHAATNIQFVGNYIAATGGWVAPDQPNPGWGLVFSGGGSVTITNNVFLGNDAGGLRDFGGSPLTAQLIDNILVGNGGPDLSLLGTDDVVTGNICESSIPAGLCPYPLPRFPFDTVPKGKGHSK